MRNRIGIDQEIEHHESRLVEVERTLADIDCVELDAKWVMGSLARFDEVWGVLTHDNRGRLVRAVIQRVEVDEPEGKITVLLADVGLDALAEIDARADGTPAPARSAAPPATEEARS